MTTTAIFAGQAILGPARATLERGAVLIQDHAIRAVGSADEIEQLIDEHTVRLDYPGATVMPGLIDSHVHLAFDSSLAPFDAVTHADSAVLLQAMAARAHQLLASGVTTARDLGDRDGLVATLREQITRQATRGPWLLTSGTPLTCPGGHCAFLGGAVATTTEIDERIRRNASAGADLIKVMASGGALTPGGPRMWEAQFTAHQLEQIVATASTHRLPVAAHAHGAATIADCVHAGVATIEHCSWRTDTGLSYNPEIAQAMAAQDVAVCRCVSGDWRLFLNQLGPNATPLIDSILRMRQTGVRLIAGTDAGVPGASFADYVGMLSFFAEIGFTRAEVLDMATVHPAHALHFHDVGSLRPGYRADIIVVNGDPLSNLEALRDPELVVANGELYQRPAQALRRPSSKSGS